MERAFSLSKRCYGMGLIRTKLYDTTLTSIALSVFVTNLFKIQSRILFTFLWLLELYTAKEKLDTKEGARQKKEREVQ